MKFRFDEPVHQLGVRGAYFNMRALTNVPSTDPRVKEFVEQQISNIPGEAQISAILSGYDQLHAAVSTRPDKLKSSPANLLAYFIANKDIPRINGIVDVYNAISLKSGIAIGAHDLRNVDGDIELRLTRGDEKFWPIGATKPVRVPAGEYAYVDSSNDILCRLEVRQVEKSKVTLDSRDVFFIVQGHRYLDQSLIQAAANLLVRTCEVVFGGNSEPLYP